jgi:hypothetical protein
MDEFVKSIEDNKFRSTNGLWNDLMLNDPWSVGYVSNLIQQQEFSSKEEWESFYYNSGMARNSKISQLSEKEQATLNDFTLVLTNPKEVQKIESAKKQLNFGYGRTEEQLLEKAKMLFQKIEKQGNTLSITLEECFECVRFRTICETWNGIIIREKNTILNLQNRFPKIEFRGVSGEIDYKYGVDYELYLGEQLLGAIQIKPKSYLGNAFYLQKAKSANEQKHKKYKEKFGKNAVFVISESNGNILNTDFLDKLSKFYKENT